MVAIPGGIFTMGSEAFYPEEAPLRRVRVDSFWIDETPVTNRQFALFVEATGYRTEAEVPPDPSDYPGMDPALAQAGSLVFEKTPGPADLADFSQWWRFCIGADWRHPTGPDSSLDGLEDHPVVHVTHGDALAYAAWAGKVLPSEAEWEFAARGGLEGREYGWAGRFADELAPGGEMLANFWQGLFPFANTKEDGWERTSPVRSYPANDHGLYDMIGNVWEHTADWYADPKLAAKKNASACCTIDNPRGGRKGESYDPAAPVAKIGRRVIKGGSHLCALNHCRRYRPAARFAQAIDSSTGHVGFRCAIRMMT
jgi:sulfatase modifying factor 1